MALKDHPLTTPLPTEPKERVRQDLLDIPAIVRRVREEYGDCESYNRRSAETLAFALLAAPSPRLLVLGITQDLRLGQQFVQNLAHVLQGVRAEATSSNDFLKGDHVERLEHGTVVLALSQSGQDFPTLAALHQLRDRLAEYGHGRLFVLTGEADTLMSEAVGQRFSLSPTGFAWSYRSRWQVSRFAAVR